MQTNEPLNTTPIQQFLQQTKIADASNQKEVRLTMAQAKALSFTLGAVMSRLSSDLESLLLKQQSGANEVIDVKLDGGSGW